MADDIAVDREVIKEQIHKLWPEFENFFDKNDEESVKEFLHLAFEAYRPNHEADRDSDDLHRPFPYTHGVKPHKDIPRPIDDASREIVDGEVLKPFPQHHHNIMRPLHAHPAERDEEKENNFAEKPTMWLLNDVSDEIKDQVMRPLPHKPNQRPTYSVLIDEVDGEMEQLIPQKHRPLYAPGKLDIEYPFANENVHKFRPSHEIKAEDNNV